MSDRQLTNEIVKQMLEAIRRINRRFADINEPNDFFENDEGLDHLDSICMMLIAVGESCKNLEKVTNSLLLSRYPQIDWKGVMGIRDIMSHHYFDIDADLVFSVCKRHIPHLESTLKMILSDLSTPL